MEEFALDFIVSTLNHMNVYPFGIVGGILIFVVVVYASRVFHKIVREPVKSTLTRIGRALVSDRAGYVYGFILALLFVLIAMHTPWY